MGREMSDVVFAVERWAEYFADCGDLWREHYDEIGSDKSKMPMRPDAARFQFLDETGQLLIITARRDGKMVGYLVVVVCPHPHYADVLCGFEDAYFLTSAERKGSGMNFRSQTGVRLIQEGTRVLALAGVKKVFFHTKESRNLGVVFRRLGFKKSDEIYTTWIGA